MAANSNLHAAKAKKYNEFYTQRSDIENELSHYADHFRGKTVYCNCDDPEYSEFWRFFVRVFEPWGIKKLISTHYNPEGESYGMIYEGGNPPHDYSGKKFPLAQHGDFRSEECVVLLKEADIVVTNPPFSLFHEYVDQLMKFEKDFLIIGPMSAITYKKIFPWLKENSMWLGYGFRGGNAYFSVSNGDGYAAGVYNPDTGLVKFRNCCWFTNLDIPKRHAPLDLRGNYYDPNKYPKYNNYDVIEVGKIAEIPCDYNGVMGVPITFLDKYCPEQFELVGVAEDNGKGQSGVLAKWDGKNPHCVVNGKNKYKRVFIRRKEIPCENQ